MRLSSIQAFALAAALAVAGTALPGTARAQAETREGIALQNQIYQLRQEVMGLRDQLARGGAPAGRPGTAPSSQTTDMVAQLLTRVDALEDQLRQLRGHIDEVQYQSQRQAADLGKRIDDLAFQVNPQGGAPAVPGGGVQPANPPVPGGPIPLTPPLAGPKVRTPEVAMQEGNAALARRDYPAAEAAAREVLAAKTSPRAYDGQLLLAQSLFGQRLYSEAAIAYDDTYKRSRKGAHAQDALVGLANSLTGINEKKAACGTLDKLRAEFPLVRPDLRDSVAAAAQRAGCH